MKKNKINSRSKGNRFERTIAKWWQEWTGYEFGRVPGSGSLRWKKTDNITGDLCCTDDKHARRFPFSIECKSYEDIRFEHILLGNKSCKILGFWEQASRDAKRANKVPILIMKYNSMKKGESFMIMRKDLASAVLEQKPKKPFMVLNLPEDVLYVFMASDLKEMEYTTIYKKGRLIIKN